MNEKTHANPQDGTHNNGDDGIKKAPNSLDNLSKEELAEKFKASAKGAQDLLASNKAKDARIAELEALNNPANDNSASDTLYEGFEHLPEEERKNVLGLTNAIKDQVKSEITDTPVFQEHAQRVNETKFDTAFNMVAAAYPELMDKQKEFKAKYFQPNNVPDNIEQLIEDMAKIFLYDTAHNRGVEEGIEKANHVDDALRTDGGSGGENLSGNTHKSLLEWDTLRRTNPAKFASLAQQYDEDMASGKLK